VSDTPEIPYHHQLKNRFRGYFPVIIDVETAGFDAKKDALLELAAITLKMDENGNLQSKYYVDEIMPGTIFKINFLLGFKIERRIDDYFDQVLKDLMDEGTIPNRSAYPSLRQHNIPPDLKYVIIDNIHINNYLLTFKEKIILNIYHFVKYIGSNDFKAWGVAPHNVIVESTPLLDQEVLCFKKIGRIVR